MNARTLLSHPVWLINVAKTNLADCLDSLTAGTTIVVIMHPAREMYREKVDIVGKIRWAQLNQSVVMLISWYATKVIHGEIMLCYVGELITNIAPGYSQSWVS